MLLCSTHKQKAKLFVAGLTSQHDEVRRCIYYQCCVTRPAHFSVPLDPQVTQLYKIRVALT